MRELMINWEGAELCFYLNGESHAIDLSDTQFAVITKILGLETKYDGTIQCFSDDTLKNLARMKGNPLTLTKI